MLPASGNSSPSETPGEAFLRDAESTLFGRLLAGVDARNSPSVFILGGPRTGSTLLYQVVARFLRLPYFSNLANEVFAHRPAVAGPLLRDLFDFDQVEFTSAYGKTRGAFQPSEASGVMRQWFGGGHPSQIKSTSVLDGKSEHLANTMAAMHALFGLPVVTKNPWNCFRVASIAEHLSRAFFVWVRRDIVPSALSDLAARYVVQGSPDVWNSATPARYEAMQKELPYWEQVVENQYEFSKAIRDSLSAHAADRHVEIWYEDLLRDPTACLGELAERLGVPSASSVVLGRGEKPEKPFRPGDEDRLKAYVDQHGERFGPERYRGR